MIAELAGFAFGACAGSFLNVCVHRLPRNESVVFPPSRCYACGSRIAAAGNIPLVSYLVLRGRCAACGSGFSPRYWLMELATGLLAAGAVHLVLRTPGWGVPWLMGAPDLALAAALAAALTLLFTLIIATMIDFDHLIIPDELTAPLMIVALPLAACCGSNLLVGWEPSGWFATRDVFGQMSLTTTAAAVQIAAWGVGGAMALAATLPLARLVYTARIPADQAWSPNDHRAFRLGALWMLGWIAVWAGVSAATAALADGVGAPLLWSASLAQAALGALAGFAAPYLVGVVGTAAFGRNAMGFGDVKLLAPVGAFLGPVGVGYTFLFAAVIGAAVGIPQRLLGGGREIPFGPYLAAGAVLALTVGPWLHRQLF